jgi:adenosylhomocysteine nucleosidase
MLEYQQYEKRMEQKQMKKIGIIGAMELEVETLKSKMNVVKTTKKANMEFFEGTLNGVEVVIVRSGIGKVNAGICTQILADLFDVTHIINTGIAGSLDAQIDIGDIVVSTDVLQHDMDVRVFGYPLGEIPQLGTLSFPADERMASLARSVCEKVNTEVKVFSGRIVSGDQFICDKEVKDKLVENFHPLCTEMEGAAIAHAAYLNKVSCVIIRANEIPFVILRAISDKADNSAEMDYPTFEKKAAEHCAKLVEEFIVEL